MNDPIVLLLGNWASELNWGSVLLRLVLALLAGGVIGSERSNKHHTAGLRTLILVCVASCLAMITNKYLNITSNGDVGRLGAAVLTGIGFIGAGAIMITGRNQVMGITTAAALWGCGALGLAFGAGFYFGGIIATVLIFISLLLLPKFESKLKSGSRGYDLHIELLARTDLKRLLEYVRTLDLKVMSITYDPAYANTGLSVYTISFFATKEGKDYIKVNELKEKISCLEYVHFAETL